MFNDNKNDWHHQKDHAQKTAYKTLKHFFNLQIVI